MFTDDHVDKGKAKREAAKKNRARANAAKAKQDRFIADEEAKKQATNDLISSPHLPPILPTSTPTPPPPILPTLPILPSPPTTPSSSTPSAAQIAARQRESRAKTRSLHSAALAIQSLARRVHAHTAARATIARAYDTKVALLLKISTAIVSPAPPYIPPPATASNLTSSFLFFKTGSLDDDKRLGILTKYVLLPGLTDPDLHPLLPWLQSTQGRHRLSKLLAALLQALSTCPSIQFPATTIAPFLTAILTTGSNGLTTLSSYLRHSLLQPPLSLLPRLRSHLLRGNKLATPALVDLTLRTITPADHCDVAATILSVPNLQTKVSANNNASGS